MISSNSLKIYLIVFSALLLTASCNFFQSNSDQTRVQDSESEIQTNIPFSTKEPETFQAEIVVSIFTGDKQSERKYFVAKKAEKLLTTFGVGNKTEASYLLRSEDERFLINHRERTIQKRNPVVISINDGLEHHWRHFLVTKLLNERQNATFEKIGVENNLTKYLVRLDGSTNSEVLVFIDEKIPFPVKQEFYNTLDGKRILTSSVEVKEFKLEVEDKLFELPKDYEEIN